MSFRGPWSSALFLGLLSLAALIVSYQGFSGSFFLDDQKKIVDNPDIKVFSEVPKKLIFKPLEPYNFSHNDPSRPLLYFTYALDYHFFKLEPWGYRAVNLGLHLLCVAVVFALLRLLLMNSALPWLPFVLTAFFALHPVSVTTLIYVFKRSDLLMTLFYLLALYIPLRQKSFTSRGITAVAGCFVLALASKQSAVTLPAVLVLFDYFFISERSLQKLKSHWRVHLSMWMLLLFYLILRYVFLGGVGDLEALQTWERGHYLVIQPWITLRYLFHFVWPQQLSIDHDVRAILDFKDIRLWVSVAVFSLLTFGIYRFRNWIWAHSHFVFGGAFFLLGLMPTSSFFPTTTAMDDNRLFLSFFGILLMSAAVIERLSHRKLVRNIILAGSVVAVGLAAGSSYARSKIYANPVLLWQDVLRQYPESYRAYISLGNEYYRLRDWDDAVFNYEKAISLSDDKPEPYSNLGNVYFYKGDLEKAADFFRKALEQEPNFVPALTNLSHVQILQKDFTTAERNLLKATETEPTYALAYNNLGILHLELKSFERAKDFFLKALRLDPDNLNTYYNLGLVSVSLGDKEAALKYFQYVLSVRPSDEDAKIWVEKLNN